MFFSLGKKYLYLYIYGGHTERGREFLKFVTGLQVPLFLNNRSIVRFCGRHKYIKKFFYIHWQALTYIRIAIAMTVDLYMKYF